MRCAVITGASSGIGRDLALEIAQRRSIETIVLVARRVDRLNDLADTLRAQHPSITPVVLSADLSLRPERIRIVETLRSQAIVPDALINNAGFGSLGSFGSSSLDRELGMSEVNCLAAAHLTHLLLPDLIQARPSRILLVSSVAAFSPVPFFSTYAATKAFDLSIGLALREELRFHGVSVTVLCPGPTETEFGQVAGAAGNFTTPTMSAKNVAKKAISGLISGQAIVIPGVMNKLLAVSAQFLGPTLSEGVAERLIRRAIPRFPN